MAKVLNLDAIRPEQRFLQIANKKHEILEMTVDNFVQTTQEAERLATATVGEQLLATVDMIRRSVPSLDADTLRARSLVELQTIVAFIRGDHLVDAVEDDSKQAPASGKAKARKSAA